MIFSQIEQLKIFICVLKFIEYYNFLGKLLISTNCRNLAGQGCFGILLMMGTDFEDLCILASEEFPSAILNESHCSWLALALSRFLASPQHYLASQVDWEFSMAYVICNTDSVNSDGNKLDSKNGRFLVQGCSQMTSSI